MHWKSLTFSINLPEWECSCAHWTWFLKQNQKIKYKHYMHMNHVTSSGFYMNQIATHAVWSKRRSWVIHLWMAFFGLWDRGMQVHGFVLLSNPVGACTYEQPPSEPHSITCNMIKINLDPNPTWHIQIYVKTHSSRVHMHHLDTYKVVLRYIY